MMLVIDAYNVLKQKPHHMISAEKRDQYIRRIRRYCQLREHTAWIVFDGGDYLYPVTEKHSPVAVMYSGDTQTADSCIQRLVLEQPIDNTVVISSDNEIVQYAREYGYISLDPQTFSYYVNRALEPNKAGVVTDKATSIKRYHNDTPEHVNRLMEMASEQVMLKDDDMTYAVEDGVSQHKHTLSRHEKLLQRIVRKL